MKDERDMKNQELLDFLVSATEKMVATLTGVEKTQTVTDLEGQNFIRQFRFRY